ncbi:MAG: NAD-dependent epimerase/dehydratase family protein, partial [Bacillota bacterium]
TVYLGHQRTSLYIDDCTACLANLAENFKPGEVYNIAGREVHDMKTASDMVLEYLGKNDRQVRYVNEERFTTRTKLPDNTKAVQDLGLTLKVGLREGIARTVDWMKEVYRPEL